MGDHCVTAFEIWYRPPPSHEGYGAAQDEEMALKIRRLLEVADQDPAAMQVTYGQSLSGNMNKCISYMYYPNAVNHAGPSLEAASRDAICRGRNQDG